MKGMSLINEVVSNHDLVFVGNTQQEYWRRELNGLIYEKDDSYQEMVLLLISRGICPVFQIDNDSSELEFLTKLPKDSIIVWCHSDESYDLEFNRQISEISAIKVILRPYRINKFHVRKISRAITQTVMNLRYSKNTKFSFKVFLWQIRGFLMQYRQWKIQRMYSKNQKKFLNVLIGYTNIFAISLVHGEEFSGVPADKSLFELLSPLDHEFGDHVITFSGQTGQVVRETALRALSKFPESVLVHRDSYGASNVLEDDVRVKGAEYVDSLKRSCLVLCPPGNISGESFRIFETVLMRRIPVAIGSVTSDPNYELPFKFLGPWHSRFSWGGVIKEAIGTEPEILRNMALSNFDYYQEEIRRIRMILKAEAFSGSPNLAE